MLLLGIIIVLLFNGSCAKSDHNGHNHDHRHHSKKDSNSKESDRDINMDLINAESNEEIFFVEAVRDIFYGAVKIKFNGTRGDYRFDIGNTVELTCKQQVKSKKSLTLQWKDSYDFETEQLEDFRTNAIRLKIKPDMDDVGLKFTCYAYGPEEEKNITVKLVGYETKSAPLPQVNQGNEINGQPIYLETGAPYKTDANCNGIVRFPEITNLDPNKVASNSKIIDKFNEKYNGTTISCITYKKIGEQYSLSENINSIKSSKVMTYERWKTRFTLYVKPETEIGQKTEVMLPEIKTETEIKTQDVVVKKSINTPKVKETGSQNSAVAVVGGVLGSIIAVLVTIIIFIWYKKIRGTYSDGAANQVIYAEIEEMPARVPPPRRVEPPYAKIIGSLVPKNQAQPNQEHLYCTVK